MKPKMTPPDSPALPCFPGPVESATVAPGGPGTDTLWWRVTIAVSESRRVVLVGNFVVESSPETWGYIVARYSHHEAWEKGHRDVWSLAGQYALDKFKPEHEIALELELRQALNRMFGFRLVVDAGHMLPQDDREVE